MATSKTTSTDAPKDPRVAEYLERAQRARKQRKLAPNTKVSGDIAIPQKDIIEQMKKQDAERGEDWHYFFGDRKLSDRYADRGNEPAMQRGQQVSWDGDPLWRCPKEMHEEDLKRDAELSKSLLRRRSIQEKEGSKSNKASAGESRYKVSDVKLAELEKAAVADAD